MDSMDGPPRRILRTVLGLTFAALPCLSARADSPPAWKPVPRIAEAHLVALAASSSGRQLYAASANAIFRSTDGGASWRACFQAPGGAAFHRVALDPSDVRHILATSSDGLFMTRDAGDHWQRVSTGLGAGERQTLMAAFQPAQPETVFVGTAGGLLVSRDGGTHWQSAGTRLSGHEVRHLAFDADQALYAVSDDGLFRSRDALSWDRLFQLPAAEPAVDASETTSTDSAPAEEVETLTAIAVDPQSPHPFYLASTHGLYVSQDQGATWHRQPGSPERRLIRDLLLLAHSPTAVYLATDRGVLELHPPASTWESRYAGLPTDRIESLASSSTTLWAATAQGLYQLDLSESPDASLPPTVQELLGNFVHEPSIQQVHDAAIRQADVDQHMIHTWRRQAALKGLLPTFSVGYDRKQDTYLNGIGSTTNPNFDRIISTDDPSRNMDLSLHWDLGNLIWNDDQTSIDTRSRLLVQLRDDILSDVTRTYFERRRLQIELLTDPPKSPSAQLQKELRLQELTALIDSLTGGWFSAQLAPRVIR